MNRRSLILSTVAALATSAYAGPATALLGRSRRFDEGAVDDAAARLMSLPSAPPGLAIAVCTPGRVHTNAFGHAALAPRVAATTDTAFYIASAAKSFTAMAFSALASRGGIDLEATLANFAPEVGIPDAARPAEVKLRDLLTHTHGINNDALAFRLAATGQHDPETLWALLASCSVNERAPLGQFQYTNVGYNILTLLTDRMLGVRWQDIVAQNVLSPAGFTRTSTSISAAAEWSRARPHYSATPEGGIAIEPDKVDATMHSAGGIITSANDAARWLELLMSGGAIGRRRGISAAAISAAVSPLVSVGREFGAYQRDHYGLGWYLGRYRDDLLVHHFGSSVGARAHFSFMPERRIGVAVLINDSAPIAEAADALANFVYDHAAGRADAGASFDAALTALSQAQQEQVASIASDRAARQGRQWTLTRPFAAYAGRYENPRWGAIEVYEGGDGLRVRYGVLDVRAEPFTAPDTIRVEFQPFSGDIIQFAFRDGATPLGLGYSNQRFMRR